MHHLVSRGVFFVCLFLGYFKSIDSVSVRVSLPHSPARKLQSKVHQWEELTVIIPTINFALQPVRIRQFRHTKAHHRTCAWLPEHMWVTGIVSRESLTWGRGEMSWLAKKPLRLSSGWGGECHWDVCLEIMKLFPAFQRGSCVESAATGANQTQTYRLTAAEVPCSKNHPQSVPSLSCMSPMCLPEYNITPQPKLSIWQGWQWSRQEVRYPCLWGQRDSRRPQKVSGEASLTVISSPVSWAASFITSIVLFVCRGTYNHSSTSISSCRSWIPNALMSG